MARIASVVAFCMLLGAITAADRADTGVILAASAGLGGVTRPGTWTPVAVTITNTAGAIDGDLIAEWGHAEVRRALHLASPSERHVEIAIRANDVTDRIRVRFVSKARELAEADAPIRIARPEDSFVLCVQWSDPARCTTTIDPERLPSSWRGYDAVDELVWFSSDRARLSVDQRESLNAWEIIHPFSAAGRLASAPSDPEPTGAPLSRDAWLFGVYLGSIAIAALAWRTRAGLARRRALMLCGVVVAGSTAMLAAGRVGPGTSVLLTENTVVDVFAGLPDALVSVRAVAEFPSPDTYALGPTLSDSAIDFGDGVDTIQSYADDDSPLLTGMFGAGSLRTFALNGLAKIALLQVTPIDGGVHVTNASNTTFTNCAIDDGTDGTRPARTLEPGGSVDVRIAASSPGATLSCGASGSIVPFGDPRHAVESRGHVRVVLHLPLHAPASAAGDSRP